MSVCLIRLKKNNNNSNNTNISDIEILEKYHY